MWGVPTKPARNARRLGLPLAIMDKRRHADDEKVEIKNMIGEGRRSRRLAL